MPVFHDADGESLASNGALKVTNETFKVRDMFEIIDDKLWEITTDTGDALEIGGNTQGSGYLKVSKASDQDDTDTILLSKFVVSSPVRIALGMTLSQRLAGQQFSFGLVGVNKEGNIEADIPRGQPMTVASVSQTTTTLTVVTDQSHGLVPNDRFEIWDVSDSRANYGELMVATVVSPTSFTATSNPSAAIPSVTISTITNSGLVRKVDPLNRANNGLSIFWEGTSSSNAKIISRSQKGSLFNSTDASMGSSHTAGVQANTQAFADAWNPSHLYDVRYKAESVIVRTMPIDSVSTQGGIQKRSNVIPDLDNGYKIRIKATNNKAMTKPVAKIIKIAKAGSTTATITTDVPHGLTVTDYIQLYGARDQTNFPNLTTVTAVASVVDDYNFRVVVGASATATSCGGVVIKVNGGKLIAPITQTIQSIQTVGGQMFVTGSGTWAGLLPGETAELRGLVDLTTGENYTQYEGAFKVLGLSTTRLTLQVPFEDHDIINVGGAVLKRTDLRLHLFRALDYTRHTVEVDGGVGNSTDIQESLGVSVTGGTVTTVSTVSTLSGGQAAHDAAVAGSPLRIAGKSLTTDVTVSATGDVTDLVATMGGALITRPYSIPELEYSYSGTAITNTTDVVLKALLALKRNYLTAIQIQNTHATVGTEVVIKDGSTVIWRGYAPANMQVLAEINFNTPLKTSVAAALNFACITGGANVYVNAQGYTAH